MVRGDLGYTDVTELEGGMSRVVKLFSVVTFEPEVEIMRTIAIGTHARAHMHAPMHVHMQSPLAC